VSINKIAKILQHNSKYIRKDAFMWAKYDLKERNKDKKSLHKKKVNYVT